MARNALVTQTDIAKLAGVTRLTVQRALQGKPGVGAPTAQRIRRLAKQHGYMPNAAATATRTGRFHAVGLLIGSATPRYLPAELVHGVEQALLASRDQLLFSSLSDADLTDTRFMPRILQHLMIDGLLIHYTHQFPAELPELIERNRVPSIWINTRLPQDCVFLDDEAASYEATRTLIDHGHRHIAYLDRDPVGHYSETDRLAGYTRAMHEAGLPLVTHQLNYPKHPSPQNDTRLADSLAWLRQANRPTAVLAYSSTLLGPLAAAALALGIRIPADLSLIGFDRLVHSPIGLPLTCVQTSMEEAAHLAVQMLHEKIRRPDAPQPAECIMPQLNELVSVAPPPSGKTD